MYTIDLLKDLDDCVGTIISKSQLDDIFNKYDWEWAGYSRNNKLTTYIEGPMDRFIDVMIARIDEDMLLIKGYAKLCWND